MTDHIDTAQEREKLAAMSGHTPGPWDLTTIDHGSGGGGAVPSTLFRVGFVGERHYTGHVADKCHGDSAANARLIAAAPDLLASNHRLLDALDAERARAEKAEAEVGRLRAALNDIYENVEYWNTLRISSRIRSAMQRKEGNV